MSATFLALLINSRYVVNVTVAIEIKTVIRKRIFFKKITSHLFNTTFEVRAIREANDTHFLWKKSYSVLNYIALKNSFTFYNRM